MHPTIRAFQPRDPQRCSIKAYVIKSKVNELLLYKLPCVIPGNGHHRSVHCQLLQCERGLKLALISALALAISQLIFVHDPSVVVLMFESSLRVKLSLASRDEGTGAKIRFASLDRRSTPRHM